MRTLALGDIHGCLTALDTVLDAAALGSKDRIVALGDFVDRGPNSRGTLDRLIGLHRGGQLVPILGNHDEMFLTALTGGERKLWLCFGGIEALQSYGHLPTDSVLDRVPAEHLAFLRDHCKPYWETDEHIFAHALLLPDVPLDQQPPDVLRWDKLGEPIQHVSGKTLICGHTRQRSGQPLVMPGTICIDTGVYGPDGWLTCLDVASGSYWQANEKGQSRAGHLDRLR